MERKKKRKTARKRCNTCIHFKLSVNPEKREAVMSVNSMGDMQSLI